MENKHQSSKIGYQLSELTKVFLKFFASWVDVRIRIRTNNNESGLGDPPYASVTLLESKKRSVKGKQWREARRSISSIFSNIFNLVLASSSYSFTVRNLLLTATPHSDKENNKSVYTDFYFSHIIKYKSASSSWKEKEKKLEWAHTHETTESPELEFVNF